MSTPVQNLHLAGQYLSKLSSSDISNLYYSGQQKYKSSFWSRVKMFFSVKNYLNQLHSFYPYQSTIKSTLKKYESEFEEATGLAVATTAISWFTIFNLARKGYVLPFLRQYGSFFKTHRLFRHYLYALILPINITVGYLNWNYLDRTETLWKVHSRRMNQRITADPANTEYPKQLLPQSWAKAWRTQYINPLDLPKKWENQTLIFLAPDYQQPEYEVETKQEEQEQADEQ